MTVWHALRAFSLALICAATPSVVASAPYYFLPDRAAAAAPPPAIPSVPHALVESSIGKLARFLLGENDGRGPVDPSAVRGFLETEIAPHLDFAAMGRWAAGPFYRQLDDRQRALLAAKLEDMLLEALARNLGTYGYMIPHIQVLPPRSEPSGLATVQARVFMPDAYPITLDFRFFERGDRWRVFDVSANGFSAVGYYRRYFATLVRQFGPGALYE